MPQERLLGASSTANFSAAEAMVREGEALQSRKGLKTLGVVTVEHRREGKEPELRLFDDITGAFVHVVAAMRLGSVRRDLGAEMVASASLPATEGGTRHVLMHRRLAVTVDRLVWVEAEGAKL